MQPRNPVAVIPGKYYNANPVMLDMLAEDSHFYLSQYRDHVNAKSTSTFFVTLAANIVIFFIIGVVLFVVMNEAPGTISNPSWWFGSLFAGFCASNAIMLSLLKIHANVRVDDAIEFLKTPLETNRSESEYGNGLRFLEWLSVTYRDKHNGKSDKTPEYT